MTVNRSGVLRHITFPRSHGEGASPERAEYIAAVVRQVAPEVAAEDMGRHLQLLGARLELLHTLSDEAARAVDFSQFLTPHSNSPALFRFGDDSAENSAAHLASSVAPLVFHAQVAVYNARQALSKL